jgi:hypothetical protein
MVTAAPRRRPAAARVTTGLLLCLLARAAASVPLDGDGAGPCRARATVEPRVAFVGEQVIHRVELGWGPGIDRMEWLRPPAFPDHRVVALSSRSAGSSVPDDPATAPDGGATRVERRALIAGRAGRLTLPEATLRCVGRDPDTASDRVVMLPAIPLEVRPPPAEGRPADFSGLVGPIEWHRRVDRKRVALGERLVLEVRLSGPNDVGHAALEPAWVRDPGHPVALDAFAAGEHVHETRGERLVTRRTARFDLVPRRTGAIEIPPQSLVWLDPGTGRYVRTRTPALTIDVLPAGAAADTDAPAPVASAEEPPATGRAEGAARPADRAGPLWRTALAAITLATLSFAAGWLLFRSRSGRRPVDSALRAADAARAAGDRRREAEALERALRAALAERSPALAGLSPPELAFRGADDERLVEAADLLGSLEAVRFGAEPGVPDRDAVKGWLAAGLR